MGTLADETEDYLKTLSEDCSRVAGIVARDYGLVEPDDLTQELLIHAWRAGDKVKDRDKWLFRAARGLALDLHEKAQKDRSVIQYEYTSAEVRKALSDSFDYSKWDHIPINSSARSAPRGIRPQWDEDARVDIWQDVNDPTDARDVAVDLQICLDLLEEKDRVIIIRYYKLGEQFEGSSAERKALYRAVDKLTKKLNTYRGRGQQTGRRSMSNAQANATIARAYEE